MTIEKSLQYEVVAGPSREELFFALWLCHEGRKVCFTMQNPDGEILDGVLEVQVQGLHIEDGSGNNWIIRVRARTDLLGSYQLKGYYNTNRRRGWLRAVDAK